jgi:hypothetical protein
LSRKQLKEIALSEGLKIPEKASKDAIIRELLSLSMSRIRELVSEYAEEIERTTIIKEKIKRRGRMEGREKTEIKATLSRAEIITSLMENKVKLHPSIIEEFGEKFGFHPKTKGDIFAIYNTFTDEALRTVYDCFIKKKLDRTGRFLEYRFAQWMANRDKEITRIDIDKQIPNVGEIDVIGYDEYGKIISIAECKARRSKASKEDIDPWLRSIELIFNKTKGSLKKAYFVNVAGFTDGIIERMLQDKRIEKDGFFIVRKSIVKFTEGDIVFRAKEGVNIYLCEERSGKIEQIFPQI